LAAGVDDTSPSRSATRSDGARPSPAPILVLVGQAAGADFQFPDSDRRLEFTIFGMEMRWSVFIKEHADDNSVENTDGWHFHTPPCRFMSPR
jgi:hypothetical protein